MLTEDDYFDFLIGVTRNQDLVPAVVRRRLSDSALMFVGFRLDEWDFRVLYRSLMSSEGGDRREEYTHVAVQIDPEEDATIDAGRAREYLEEYFQDSRVSLYWGTHRALRQGAAGRSGRRRAMTAAARRVRVDNPYVGPMSFRLGDPLYGRDREREDLLDLLSPSGSCCCTRPRARARRR